MRALVLHLSDLHIRSGANNTIIDRSKDLASAVRPHLQRGDVAGCIVAVSGDVTFSGKSAEYGIAEAFFSQLKDALAEYLNPSSISLVFVPGNHDCNHEQQAARQAVITTIPAQLLEIGGSDSSIIDLCTSVQDEFFRFLKRMHPDVSDLTANSRLRYNRAIAIAGKRITVECYNTAWMSQLQEKQAGLFYPPALLDNHCQASDLVLSLFHHPYNWLESNNARTFRQYIEQRSDVILTGHEHEAEVYERRSASATPHYIEGAALQDNARHRTGFNVLTLDLDSKMSEVREYSWSAERGLYEVSRESTVESCRNKSRESDDFTNDCEFVAFLDDPGAAFTHPRIRNLTLRHIFVYPDFTVRTTATDAREVLNGEKALDYLLTNHFLMVAGPERAGKTTFAKVLYQDSKARGLVPVFVSGKDIKSSSIKDFSKLVQKNFCQQYSANLKEKYEQLSPDRKIVLIDDFDESRLNTQNRAKFLNSLTTSPNMVAVFADTILELQEIANLDECPEALVSYKNVTIRELGYVRRSEMIEKWLLLGQEDSAAIEEIADDARQIEKSINTLKGRHLIPSYPLFILVILQQLEAGTNLSTFSGAYGYIYEALITKTLAMPDHVTTLDTKYTFLSILAHHMFAHDQDTVSGEEIATIASSYFNEYKIQLDIPDLLRKLQGALVLFKIGDGYKFKYKYLYYYFVARFFRDHIGIDSETDAFKVQLRDLTSRIYNEDAANILIFYIYLSKDPETILNIVQTAKSVFAGCAVWSLEGSTQFLNQAGLLDAGLEFDAANRGRKKYLKFIDDVDEMSEKDNARPESAENIEKEESRALTEMDDSLQLNVAFKAIQIMGQILRNFPGSLKGDLKKEIATETYRLGLRALNIIFGQLRRHRAQLLQFIKTALANKAEFKESEIDEHAEELFFFFCMITALAMIKAISYSVGSGHLKETYKDVLASDATSAFLLIDLSIRLDNFRPTPEKELKLLHKQLSKDRFGMFLLRILALEHMYLFPCDYRTVQRICSELSIPIKKVRQLEAAVK